MLAGTLDRRFTWQRASKTTDDFGGEIETWATLFETWCAKVALTGAEAVVAAEVVDEETVKLQFRWRDDVQTTDRFIFEGRVHRVTSLVELGRRDGLEVIGRTRTDAPRMVES